MPPKLQEYAHYGEIPGWTLFAMVAFVALVFGWYDTRRQEVPDWLLFIITYGITPVIVTGVIVRYRKILLRKLW